MNKTARESRARTSDAHPIYVAQLPSPFSGRVGLTLAPGKHATSHLGRPWGRDLAKDLDRLVSKYEAHVLVCLLEEQELARLGIPNLVAEAKRRGLEVLRLPIPDGGVLPALEPVERLVEAITEAAESGRNVVIHCRGGLGRAGTIGGCFLARHGATGDEAIATLHRCRSPNCPETLGQERFIRAFAERGSARALSFAARVEGAVLGAAIGDAMGHPTEFLGLEALRARFGPNGVEGFELFWTEGGARFAPYTDDTQMAEAVARGLLDGGATDDLEAAMTAIAARFVEWARAPQGGHRAPGNACLAGCEALARGVPWSSAGGAESGGCGSVMRAYPLGVRWASHPERAERWAVAQSRLTHGHPIALAASAAMAVGVARLLRGEASDPVLEAMIAAADRWCSKTATMMTRALEEARAGTPPTVTLERLRGWAAHEAIAAAIYVFARHPADPRAAILEGANTPGDSDSIATLAGALAGAHAGLDALPSEWVRDVERGPELSELARELAASASLSS